MKHSTILFLLLINLPSFAQKPFVLGHVRELKSQQLNETRTVNVYLPEGYNDDDTTHYPVIYLLDGSAGEDFIHIVGLVQFSSFEWVNRLQKTIVVGIANVDRKRDFTYPTSIDSDRIRYPTTGHSAAFINFIQKELQPFIEDQYRTNKSRTLIGESLGGLLATEILLKQPELFNKYIIVSPSLWWDDGSLLRLPMNHLKTIAPTEVYIGVGKEGMAPNSNHVMETDAALLTVLLRDSGSRNLTVYFDYLEEEDHATIMHQAVMNAFKIMGQSSK